MRPSKMHIKKHEDGNPAFVSHGFHRDRDHLEVGNWVGLENSSQDTTLIGSLRV